MNCATHTDTPAAAFCRTCGKALCENCKRDVMGAIYCEPCIAARLQGAGPAAAAQPVMVPMAAVPNAPSPGLALLLGFIPGVGAMYNGQFLKAFIHVVIFTLLVMAANRIDAFGLLVAFWVFYMAFEAYKTAQAKMLGQPAPDLLGIERIFGIQEESHPAPPPFVASAAAGSAPESSAAPVMSSSTAENQPTAVPAQMQTPTGAIVLIVLGVLFLLGNIGYLPGMDRTWPLILIGLGLWIAYKHMRQRT